MCDCNDCKYRRKHYDQIPCKTCIYNLGSKDNFVHRKKRS